jgi:hypothetical protein
MELSQNRSRSIRTWGPGDQHGAVLPCFGIEVRGAAGGPLAAAAVADAIAALELAEGVPAERPPGLFVVHEVKRMRHNTNRCTDNLWRTSMAQLLAGGPRPSPAGAR